MGDRNTGTLATGNTNSGSSDVGVVGGTAFLQDRVVITSGTFSAGNITFKIVGTTALAPTKNYSFKVASGSSATSLGTMTFDTTSASSFAAYNTANIPNGGGLSLVAFGNDVYLNATPVPEPGTIHGLVAAGIGLAGWIRRRKFKSHQAPRGA